MLLFSLEDIVAKLAQQSKDILALAPTSATPPDALWTPYMVSDPWLLPLEEEEVQEAEAFIGALWGANFTLERK